MDAGDTICDVFSNKTFNMYNARSLLKFILEQKKKLITGEKTSFYDAQTKDIISTQNPEGMPGGENRKKPIDDNDLRDIEFFEVSPGDGRANLIVDHDMKAGFEQEVLPSRDIAALKAYALNNDFNINCTQVHESLLFKTEDYNRYKNNEDLVQAKIGELMHDKEQVYQIVTSAKIEEQKIEKELFCKLPYFVDENTLNETIHNTKALTDEEFNNDLADNEIKNIKDELMGKPEYEKIKDFSQSASVPKENIDYKKHDNVTVFWDKEKIEEPTKAEINEIIKLGKEQYPNNNIDGIELAIRQNDEKLIDVSFYENNNKFAAYQQKRNNKLFSKKEKTNKEKVFERLQNSKKYQQKGPNTQKINDKTIPNVKIPNKI